MRITRWLLATCLCAGAGHALALDDFNDICHAGSSYDVSVAASVVAFERGEGSPRRVELHAGRLTVDGATLRLNTEDGDRLVLFEQEVRALVPKAKEVARNGVDLAIKAVQAEARAFGIAAETQAGIGRVLMQHGAAVKRRIGGSTSTRDWQGDVLERIGNETAADIAPLITADLARQAADAAMGADLDALASLRERPTDLLAGLTGDGLLERLEPHMQALRPQVAALCPSVRRLYELQRGLRGASGRPLDLIELERN
jgi:hypothetical protein